MPVCIGILGPAGSGKSAVATHLVENYGAKRYSLAAPLKQIAKNVFDFSDAQLYGTQAEKEADDPRYNFSPRWLLQRLGTEGIRRVFGHDIWVDTMLKNMSNDPAPLVVCDDVRFMNEATKIRQWKNGRGFVWRLESLWRETKADATHQSEAEWSMCEYDYRIAPKTYGMETLYALVDEACFFHNIPRTK